MCVRAELVEFNFVILLALQQLPRLHYPAARYSLPTITWDPIPTFVARLTELHCLQVPLASTHLDTDSTMLLHLKTHALLAELIYLPTLIVVSL